MKKFLLSLLALLAVSCTTKESNGTTIIPLRPTDDSQKPAAVTPIIDTGEAYTVAMRAFYLWRCGMAVEADYQGNHYATQACHLGDGHTDYLGIEGCDAVIDGTGGWHDAGDYGKYTVNAGVTLGMLFNAWEQFGPQIEKHPLSLPVTAEGMPEYLEELKWETDFLLKMQYPDGSGRVAHKLTRRQFSGFIMPQDDHEPRFFTTWSSAATADFVAMMAMAARVFKPYDDAYAARCLAAAQLSWKYLRENPDDVPFVQGDFSTGGYQTTDPDDRLWAAAEMWQTTGDAAALKDLETRISHLKPLVASDWDWGSVANLGVYTYALSQRDGRDDALLTAVRKAIVADADALVAHSLADPYGRAMENYYWGCNGTEARQALNIHAADLIQPNKAYGETIIRIVNHLFGHNVYGRSYVTGLGVNPPLHPHDRRSAADGIDAPWPGYLVGGGHTANDWVDKEEDYSRNEIAINWQAALVYLLAATI